MPRRAAKPSPSPRSRSCATPAIRCAPRGAVAAALGLGHLRPLARQRVPGRVRRHRLRRRLGRRRRQRRARGPAVRPRQHLARLAVVLAEPLLGRAHRRAAAARDARAHQRRAGPDRHARAQLRFDVTQAYYDAAAQRPAGDDCPGDARPGRRHAAADAGRLRRRHAAGVRGAARARLARQPDAGAHSSAQQPGAGPAAPEAAARAARGLRLSSLADDLGNARCRPRRCSPSGSWRSSRRWRRRDGGVVAAGRAAAGSHGRGRGGDGGEPARGGAQGGRKRSACRA